MSRTDHSGREESARHKALSLLEHKDRTERELRERLLRAGYGEEETEDAVAYAASYGYINDERYASNYIFGHMHGRSRGRILTELQQKGISREMAMAAWEETVGDEDTNEQQLLLDAILRKYPSGSELDHKKMRSLYGYLLRRGFSYEDIRSAISSLEIKILDINREKS
ncbi:MAG: regulatory protein RecX [Blautia sp.]|nr:regulatory protein RecX [Blautia sp.]